MAICFNDVDCVEFLVINGADVKQKDFAGNGIGHYLARYVDEAICSKLYNLKQLLKIQSSHLDFLNYEGKMDRRSGNGWCNIHYMIKQSIFLECSKIAQNLNLWPT